MTGGIVAALTVLLLSTYVVLRGRAEARTRDRMSHAVQELAREVGQTLIARAEQFSEVASQAAVRRALLDAERKLPVDTVALRRALTLIGASPDSSRPAELWDLRGTPVLSVGPAIDNAVRPPPLPTDSQKVQFSKMQQSGERVRFWIIASIEDNGRRAGYLAQPRFITGQRESLRMVREFLFDSITSYLRNADGSVWVTAPDRFAPPPDRVHRTASAFDLRGLEGFQGLGGAPQRGFDSRHRALHLDDGGRPGPGAGARLRPRVRPLSDWTSLQVPDAAGRARRLLQRRPGC